MQDIVWSISLLFMGLVAVAFVVVVAGASRGGGDASAIGKSAYRLRNRLFWVVLVAGAGISFVSLRTWPIAGHASGADKPEVVIQAVASQWNWQLDQDTVKVGQWVEFEVTAKDVNHNFALYQHKTHLIAQTQAMPGYVNRLRVRFTEPGEYEVLCLEYCGVGHHAMRAVVKVVES